ncbi:MAG: hypothetical protein HY796_10390 [Elusimicrobia bacterium]|nr:hypothetical protein [Elusimicrobiota bacterium]
MAENRKVGGKGVRLLFFFQEGYAGFVGGKLLLVRITASPRSVSFTARIK